MTPNPKIQQEEKIVQEQQDYPRWTPSTFKLLKGIQEFREAIRGRMN